MPRYVSLAFVFSLVILMDPVAFDPRLVLWILWLFTLIKSIVSTWTFAVTFKHDTPKKNQSKFIAYVMATTGSIA